MPAVEKLSIALPPYVAALMQQAVDAGEYPSQNEVVQDALRDWTKKRNLREQGFAELRAAWSEATADDTDGEDPEPVLAALERKYDALAQASGS